MYQTEIESYFENREGELTEAIRRLVAIPSVKGEAAPDAPFGPGPAAALAEGLKLAEEWGLAVQNYDGYVGLVDLNGEETALHILAHLDVVDPGGGWDTDPYTVVERDGMLYGRGVDDDKGPLVAAMLAMRAVKALGLPLKRNVRLIMGTDEESGFADLEYYYAREPYAPYAISPDAEFPVINMEKGQFRPYFQGAWERSGVLPRLSYLKGGIRTNVVPPEAEALVLGLAPEEIAATAARMEGETGAQFRLEAAEGGTLIHAAGRNAHAASPEDGVNAITALIVLLNALPLGECDGTKALAALGRLFPHGDNGGRALGIAMEDECGPLTLTFSILEMTEISLTGQFDARVPLCATEENCAQVVAAKLARVGLVMEGEQGAAHAVPEDTHLVRTLLDCYEQYYQKPGYCLAIGGGTYVHDIPGGVAFGAGDADFDSHLHGPNERVRVQSLMTAAKIYAEVIIRLCGGDRL